MDSFFAALVNQVFWLFLIYSFVAPLIRQRMLEAARLQAISALEKQRGTRVIALIHRQEALALFGIPLFRYINIEDAEELLRAVRMTPPDRPIDLILHTPGGLVLASEQIARALCNHPAKVTVFIPHYAMSGGTLIALAADEIVMDPHAVLGPVDPQLGEYPAASILRAVEMKGPQRVDDRTLILADVAQKAIWQVRRLLEEILCTKMPEDKAKRLAALLSEGTWTHDYPICAEEAKALGLPVNTDFPEEVHRLMAMYPQPVQRRASVDYVPVPYEPDTRPQPAPRRRSRRGQAT
ncbi:MAG: ATP-dependent Clp protease proteolytic subunit [bacterium]|nr:ATP-dependent Clp protease proteolytic subunit [bacterium]MDW8105385.1 ATP-dependent Clp protease proteolytic subunit [Armatimonadota bacterium]